LVLLGFATWIVFDNIRFRRSALRTTGTVVRLVWKQKKGAHGNPTSLAFPVVSFEANGEPYEIEGRTGSSSPNYEEGQSVNVLYLPKAPESGRIDSPFELYVLPIVLVLMGLIAAGLAVFLLIKQ
jgi:hypothetical protein